MKALHKWTLRVGAVSFQSCLVQVHARKKHALLSGHVCEAQESLVSRVSLCSERSRALMRARGELEQGTTQILNCIPKSCGRP